MQEINLPDLSAWGQIEILTIDEAALLWGGINPMLCKEFNVASTYPLRQYEQAFIARRIFVSGISAGTLAPHELWCYRVDEDGHKYALYQHFDKQLPSMQDISTRDTTVLTAALISWTEKKKVRTIKQMLAEENKTSTVSKLATNNSKATKPQDSGVPSLNYKPKHDNPAYDVLVSIMKDYYDTIPEGGKPLKSLALQEEISKRYIVRTGVQPTQNIVNMIDKLARPDEFKK